MNRSVLDLAIGEEAIVKDFQEERVACKLLTIGVVPQTKIAMVRRAPFGGAVCLKLGHTYIAIRNHEAKAIIID